MRFKDKVVVVTGGGSGIGLAAVMAFVAEGAKVAINDLNPNACEAALLAITNAGGKGIAIPGDVADRAAVDAAARKVMEKFGRIDVLISNAGMPNFEPAETYSKWEKSLSVNLSGHFYWAQAVARESMIPNQSGSIVITSSLAGLGALIGDIGYVTTKHGLVGMTKGLAVEWAKYGIRVNCVAPGITDSLMVRENLGAVPGALEQRVGRVPLARLGQPEEQAAAMLFLSSDDAAYITGHTIPVDGGQMALHSGYSASFASAGK
jgi:NAD(P)-dependent dehydrogenase (short-subunit alcohol dehydrogenase family)